MASPLAARARMQPAAPAVPVAPAVPAAPAASAAPADDARLTAARGGATAAAEGGDGDGATSFSDLGTAQDREQSFGDVFDAQRITFYIER